LDCIWAPWRSVYIGGNHGEGEGCVFCEKINSDDDEANLVLLRGDKIVVMLNLYPYNNGHLLIMPKRHVADMEELTVEEMNELMLMIQKMVKVLKVFQPQGFNVGANLGRLAGAGIPGHIHFHIVPRWGGDTNFMPVIGNTRVISESLEVTYKKLKESLEHLKID